MGEENFPNADEQKELSNHIRQIAQTIYEAELRREDSLIQQSTQMQTAFSFTSAALFMVAAIVHSAAANCRWCGDQRPPCGLKTAG